MFMHDTSSIMHVFFNMFAVFMFGRTLETVWGPKRFLFYYVATAIGAALTSLLVAYLRINSAESGMTPEMISEVYKNGLGILNTGKNYADPLLGELNLLLNQCTVGASGAVFGILLAFGMIFPDTKLVIIPIPVPIKAKYLVIFYGLGELLLGIWDRPGDNVAHFAHFGGLFFGLIIMLYWRKKNKEHGRFY
jgi:membrane associated rhomboid family serine protease